MVIQCENCNTRFRLPDEKLKAEGVKVRCSHCKAVFTVFPPDSPSAPEPAPTAFAGAAAPDVSPPAAGDGDFSGGFDTAPQEDAGAFAFDSPDADESPAAVAEPAAAGKDDFGFDFSEGEPAGAGESPNEFSFDETGWGEESAAPAAPTAAKGPTEFSFDDSSWDEAPTPGGAAQAGSDFSFDESPFAAGGDEAAPSAGEQSPKEFKFTELAAAAGARSAVAHPADLSPGFGEDLDLPQLHDGDLASSVPEPPVRGQKSSSAGTFFILLLILVIVAAAGAVFLWQQGQLPMVDEFLSRLQGTATVSGRIEVTNLSHEIFSHPREGDLFVIRGVAVNRYPGPRSALQVKGELYGAGSKVLAQQLAYCGNPLDESALASMSYAQMREAMGNQFGEVLSNLDVPSGKAIPFTIVFKGVPDGLSEFGVSVVESQGDSR